MFRVSPLATTSHPLVAEQDLGEFYARSAVRIILQASGTGDGAIPSKLRNLLAAGVPVFLVSDEDSEAALLLDRAGDAAGYRAGRYDGEDISGRLGAFLARCATSRAERASRQRLFVEQSFGLAPVVGDITGSWSCEVNSDSVRRAYCCKCRARNTPRSVA